MQIARFHTPRQILLLLACLMLVFVAAYRHAQAGVPAFNIGRAFGPEGMRTGCVAAGDLDGDGDLDLAVCLGDQWGNRQVVLYLNDGAGNFSTVRHLDARAAALALGDVDGDDDVDLVVANAEQNKVYLNDGAANFPIGHAYGDASDEMTSLALGDLNNDGTLDIVAGSWQRNTVYFNDGEAHFFVGRHVGTEDEHTTAIAVGDLDGDNDLDLVVGNYLEQNVVYLNDGRGNFPTGRHFGARDEATSSLAVADFDGDTDLDVVVGNAYGDYGELGQAQDVVYLNDGHGTFYDAPNPPVECAPATVRCLGLDETSSVAAGDMDNDGDMDVIIGNYGVQSMVHFNDGHAHFLSHQNIGPGAHDTISVAVGDMDGDGYLDLALGNRGQNVVYFNDGRGTFPPGRDFGPGNDFTVSIAVGDLNGDGSLDVVVGNVDEQSAVYLNDGHGDFYRGPSPCDHTPQVRCFGTPSGRVSSIAVGDVDGDHDLDLVVVNVWQGVVYLNDGAAHFSEGRPYSADSLWSLALGDLDNDADLDIVAGGDAQDRIYLNDGSGHFSEGRVIGPGSSRTTSVAVGDLNNDGYVDLILAKDTESMLYLNKGQADFPIARPLSSANSAAVGDLDGDGNVDLVLGRSLIEAYRNDGTGHFTITQSFGTGSSSIVLGDLDSDRDLDVVAGSNDRTYRNNGLGYFSYGHDFGAFDDVQSLAVGDLDRDGDLDMVTGRYFADRGWGDRNILFMNQRNSQSLLPNNPPHLALTRPGSTPDASFYSTPQVLHGPTIPISYTVTDPEGDSVSAIRVFYSLNSGGQWFPATPAPGTTTTNLAAAPTGTRHTFTWQADADLIKSDNVVVRIEAYPGFKMPGPFQRPYQAAQTVPFRVEAMPWFAQVVDEHGSPMNGAMVYYRGEPIRDETGVPRLTDQSGLIQLPPLDIGQPLVALSAPVHEQRTARAAHDGWAYRVHLSNLGWNNDSTARSFIVQGPGAQRLVISRTTPVIRFNLVVSIEWDATEAYVAEISRALRHASDYLYDLTDGQFVLGEVAIYDNGTNWANADVQIATNNIVRPHAYIGGITANDPSRVIRIGRAWDGNSGNQGSWDQPDGYRTLAHEFGHYALSLYDAYFAYTFDPNGNLTGEVPASCTGPGNRNPATDATNATAMDYHYTSSELAMQGVPGLWSSLCQATAQWQLQGESDWQTVVRTYDDESNSPRWQLTTPADRGGPLAGPVQLPDVLPRWPNVRVYQGGSSMPPRHLTVYHPNGGGYWGAIVALYQQDGRVIGQGFTDSAGELLVYGVQDGDTLRASSFDGGLAGGVVVGAAEYINLPLKPVAGTTSQATDSIPHIQVVAAPSSTVGQVDLFVSLIGFGPGADPHLTVTEPGSEVSHAPPLHYRANTQTYESMLSFSATAQGMGRVQAVSTVGTGLVRLQATYRLQRVNTNQMEEIFSNDGNLHLHLDAGSLPGNESYVVLMPPGAVPGPLPADLVLVGDAYTLTASGAVATLQKPGMLHLHYDAALARALPQNLALYRWEPTSRTWQVVSSTIDQEHQAVVAPITSLGTYALLASPGSWNQPSSSVFLPLIRT